MKQEQGEKGEKINNRKKKNQEIEKKEEET